MEKHFVFVNEWTEEKWIIPIFSLPQSYSGDIEMFIDAALNELDNRDLETIYGVHDFNTIGTQEIIGFTSSEVSTSDFPKLINIWKSILVRLGCEVGEIRIEKNKE